MNPGDWMDVVDQFTGAPRQPQTGRPKRDRKKIARARKDAKRARRR